MNELFSYIAIIAIFLAAFVPLVAGIIHYTRQNRRLDHEEALKQSNRS
jgi:hypothetical protein